MKTPQEEAEEMVDKTVNDIDQYFQNEANYRPEMKMHIQHNIPLSELISVARAAVEMLSDLQTFGSGDLDYEWEKALQALRATGKVEL